VLPSARRRARDWQASIRLSLRRHCKVAPPSGRSSRCARGDDPPRRLKEVEPQKERLVRNTRQFVAGRPPTTCCSPVRAAPARARLIKACLNEFAPQGCA
jgi:predicted AAA+ superfamily ATPase